MNSSGKQRRPVLGDSIRCGRYQPTPRSWGIAQGEPRLSRVEDPPPEAEDAADNPLVVD